MPGEGKDAARTKFIEACFTGSQLTVICNALCRWECAKVTRRPTFISNCRRVKRKTFTIRAEMND